MEVVFMPRLGMTMESGEIVEWLKHENEPVRVGEALLEISTDKSNNEVESPVDGVVARLLAEEGSEIAIGVPIAVIAAVDEAIDATVIDELLATIKARASASSPAAPASSAPVPTSVSTPPIDESAPSAPAPLQSAERGPEGSFRATPRVRKLAQDLGVDLSVIAPSGINGMITEEDVRRSGRADTSGKDSIQIRQRVPLVGARKTLFTRMSQAWQTIPHFHQIIDIDAGPLLAARKEHNVALTAFFVRAAAIALTRHPWINAAIEGDEAVLFSEVNISVAVGSVDGLVVPVIRQADQKSVTILAQEIRELAERARAGQLRPADLSGGTFTVSNLGMYGIETGTPVINPPQVALMFVGSTQTVPVFQDGNVVAGERLKITLSYDHRLIDGITAAAFSQEVRQLLHAPDQLLD